eukprot:662990-Hanusia_phi.AAC.1
MIRSVTVYELALLSDSLMSLAKLESWLSISIVTILTSRHAGHCQVDEGYGKLEKSDPQTVPLLRLSGLQLPGHGWAAASRSAYTVPPAVSRRAQRPE